MTVHCSWPTTDDANPRNSVVLVLVPGTKSPTGSGAVRKMGVAEHRLFAWIQALCGNATAFLRFQCVDSQAGALALTF